jgi:hypothetical protein
MEVLSEDEKIQVIQRQTNYTLEECNSYLKQHNGNHIDVIKQFMGIVVKPPVIKSINQEIYKQMRYKLDTSMKEYNDKNPVNMKDVSHKLG